MLQTTTIDRSHDGSHKGSPIIGTVQYFRGSCRRREWVFITALNHPSENGDDERGRCEGPPMAAPAAFSPVTTGSIEDMAPLRAGGVVWNAVSRAGLVHAMVSRLRRWDSPYGCPPPLSPPNTTSHRCAGSYPTLAYISSGGPGPIGEIFSHCMRAIAC
jgi:hypothetical protein